MVATLGMRDATDRRIVQVHGAADLGQAVAMLQMGQTNRLIAACVIGTNTGGEQLAQLRSGRKPLLAWNLFEGTRIS